MATYSFVFRSSLGESRISSMPKNWQDLKFELVRDKTYKGIGRKIAASFEFVKDARRYIRDLYYKEGIDAYMEVDIWIHNDSKWRSKELMQTYKADFKEIEINNTTATIKMVDSSFEEKIMSRANNKFDLNTLTSADGDVLIGDLLPVQDVNLHDRTILYTNKHTLLSLHNYFQPQFETSSHWPIYFNTADYVSNPDISSYVNITGLDYDPRGNDYPPEGLFLTNSKKDISIKFDIVFNLTISTYDIPGFTTVYFRAVSVDSNSLTYKSTIKEIKLFEGSIIDPMPPISYTGTMLVDLIKRDSLCLEFYIVGNSGTLRTTILENTILSENVDYHYATKPKIALPFPTAERLLQLMTGQQSPFRSPVFAIGGDWERLGILTGFMVRGFDYATHPINTSFKEWFESYSSVLNLAAYIDKKDGFAQMVVDYTYNVFDSSKVGLKIETYQELSVKPIPDEYFSLLRFGFEEIEHEEVNALNSFNGTFEFATPVQNVSDVLQKSSKYLGDDYAIALAQRKPYATTPKEDTRYDEKIMFLDCGIANGTLYSKKDEDFDTVTGITAPDKAYNLNISPARNLRRHANSIASGLYRKPDKYLRCTKRTKNSDLVSKRTDEAETITESADLLISNLGTPIFLPNFISFKTKLGWSDFKYLNEHPNELIEMNIDRVMTYGFVDRLQYSITTEEAEFILIQSNR